MVELEEITKRFSVCYLFGGIKMISLLSKSDSNLVKKVITHLFEDTYDAIYIYEMIDSTPSTFIYVNHVAAEQLGYSHEELLKLNPYDISACPSCKYALSSFLQNDNESISYEVELIKKNGETISVMITTRLAIIDNRKVIISIARDRISNSSRDPLTNLPYRNYFLERLAFEIEQSRNENRKISVLLMNLDQLNLIYDTYGFTTKNTIIRNIASRISNVITNFEKGAGFVAIGNKGEFFILLYTADIDAIKENAKILLNAIAKPIQIHEQQFFLTASIGCSRFPIHGENASELLRTADLSLQQAKAQGGDHCVVYHPSMDQKAFDSLNILNDLHRAVRKSEFILYYQPRIDMTTNQMIGAEALIRWLHPEKGIIPPAAFIPIAEQSKLIVEIGNWVITKVCQQISYWQELQYPPISVSINLSVRQLEDPDFVTFIQQALSKYNVDGSRLEFEITESMLAKDNESISRYLTSIRALGIKISIDDFGTGYSSLSTVHKFPIDSLKIDRIFLQDIKEPSKSNLVASLITLGHSMQLNVVAEGVELEEQLNFLKEHGCDEWQGYLYSKPLPVSQFEEILRMSP